MEERGSHPSNGLAAAMARLHEGLDQLDPVERLIEDRERRDAFRDVERRRLDASRHVGYEGRWVLP